MKTSTCGLIGLTRGIATSPISQQPPNIATNRTGGLEENFQHEKNEEEDAAISADGYSSLEAPREHEHAVISAFDLFSIGGELIAISTARPFTAIGS